MKLKCMTCAPECSDRPKCKAESEALGHEFIADLIKPEIRKLVARGDVTSAESKELRCNSWEWEALVPVMTDEALVEHVEYAIQNSSRYRKPASTYDEAIISLHAPELVKRLKAHLLKIDDGFRVKAVSDDLCPGTPGAASWGRCEKPKNHEPPCTHDPLQRDLPRPTAENFPVQPQPVQPGENLLTTDPRFGTPEHMQARWKAAGIQGPFFIESVPTHEGPESSQRHYIRECNGRKCVVECNGRPIADAIMDALDAYDPKPKSDVREQGDQNVCGLNRANRDRNGDSF